MADRDLFRRHATGSVAAAIAWAVWILPQAMGASHPGGTWYEMFPVLAGYQLLVFLAFTPALLLCLTTWAWVARVLPAADRGWIVRSGTLLILSAVSAAAILSLMAVAVASYDVLVGTESQWRPWESFPLLYRYHYISHLIATTAWAIAGRAVMGPRSAASRDLMH